MVRATGPADLAGFTCFPSRNALMQKTAATYFAQSRRPACTIQESVELSPWHHQLTYAC